MSNFSRTFLIRWNNNFPYDRWFRKKFSIGFGSEEHRKISQIDVFYEFYEEFLFKEYEEELEKRKVKEKLLLEGKWLQDREETDEEMERLFSNIKISSNNNESQIKFED